MIKFTVPTIPIKASPVKPFNILCKFLIHIGSVSDYISRLLQEKDIGHRAARNLFLKNFCEMLHFNRLKKSLSLKQRVFVGFFAFFFKS